MKKQNLNTYQPEGNYFDKYHTSNPIYRFLIKGFFKTFFALFSRTKAFKMGGDILEVGCGEGEIIGFLHKNSKNRANLHFYAFDISSRVIEYAKSKYEDIDFFVYDVAKKIDKKYSLIICCEVLEHISNPYKALKNMINSTDEIILSVPREPLWRILNMLRGKYMSQLGNTPGHINHFSEKKLRELLEQCGVECAELKRPLPWLMTLCRIKKED